MKRFFPVSVVSIVFSIISIVIMAAGAGCGGTDPAGRNTGLDDTDLTRIDQDSFDGVTQLRARTEALQLSVDPVAVPRPDQNEMRWALRFEANRPLLSALPFGADGELGRDSIIDAYRFEVLLDGAEIKYLLAGGPLYLRLRTANGERRDFAGVVRLGSRFADVSGSLLIWVHPEVERLGQGEDARMRGYATVAQKIETLSVFSDAGGDPESVAFDGANLWSFDWLPAALLQASDTVGNPVHLIGRDGDGTAHQVRARLVVVVAELGLTTGDALTTWPQRG